MGVVFTRIDDRLIHGQVVTAWKNHYSIETIIIVDDELYKDEFMINVLKMTAPSGVKLNVYSVDAIAEEVDEINSSKENIMIIVKKPQTALQLYSLGTRFTELNLGGMGAGPDRKLLYKNVSASNDEIKVLQEICAKGIRVYLQAVPTEKQVEFKTIV